MFSVPLFSSHHFSFSSFVYLKDSTLFLPLCFQSYSVTIIPSTLFLYFLTFIFFPSVPMSLCLLLSSLRCMSVLSFLFSFPCRLLLHHFHRSCLSVVDAFLNQLPMAGVCNDHGKTYALYTITVIRKNSDGSEDIWKTYRRYSDFHDFHMRITEQVRESRGKLKNFTHKWTSYVTFQGRLCIAFKLWRFF